MGKFSISTSLLIRAAKEKGLSCAFFPEKTLLISNGKISHYFKNTSFPCNDSVAAKLSCNKYFLRKLLKEQNLPSPRTITLRYPAAWRSVLGSSLRFPLVVKPINASHGNGSSLNIRTAGELHHAVERAFAYIRKNKQGDRILVEEFFEGEDLRFLVVGKKVVSVVKREPAYVVGDGHSTIRQLIHRFNREWYSPMKYDLPMCPIPIDSEVSRYLTRHNLTLNSVLSAGEKTHLRWNANVSTGGRPIDVTDQIHPRLKALAVRVARISHLKVSGVDILCKSLVSGDVSEANVSILEINDSPGTDIHYFPFEGQGRNIASDILDYIFGKNSPEEKPEERRVKTLLEDIQVPPTVSVPAVTLPISPTEIS